MMYTRITGCVSKECEGKIFHLNVVQERSYYVPRAIFIYSRIMHDAIIVVNLYSISLDGVLKSNRDVIR